MPQVIRLEKVKRISLRQEIAEGILPQLEYCLLRGGADKGGKKGKKAPRQSGRDDIAAMRQAERAAAQARHDEGLSWTAEEKEELLNMEIDTLRCVGGFEGEFEVEVRSLCHSRGVTADYLDRSERFNMKQVILVLGNLGKSREPWAELVHPAMFLHRQGFNIVWLDIPSFRSNQARWMKFGPAVLRTLLRSYCLKMVRVLACGLGGAVFLEALAKAPDLFGGTHLVYNMDLPSFKGFNLSIADIEDVLRSKMLQLWFTYVDDEDYDRFRDGSPQRAYDAVAKMQARLQGERERGRRKLTYDELLITENLNMNPLRALIDQRQIGLYSLLVFSEPLLASTAYFLESEPYGRQTDLDGGLVGNYRAAALSKALKGGATLPDGDVLPALRRRRLGPELGLEDRPTMAQTNRFRFGIMDTAVRYLALPSGPALHPALRDMGFQYKNLPRLGSVDPMRRRSKDSTPGSSSQASSSRSGSGAGLHPALKDADAAGLGMSGSSSAPALLPAHLRPLGSKKDISAFGSDMSPIKRSSPEDMLAQMGDDDLFGAYRPETPLETLALKMKKKGAGIQSDDTPSYFDEMAADAMDMFGKLDEADGRASTPLEHFSKKVRVQEADSAEGEESFFRPGSGGETEGDVMADYRQQRAGLMAAMTSADEDEEEED